MPRAPQPIPIVLNYAAGNFGPQPHSVKVVAGDTLVFTRGSGAAADQKIRITIADAQNFSPAQVHETLQNAVKNNLSTVTTYRCDLLYRNLNTVLDVNGHPIAADGRSGGGIEPDTGN